MDAWDKTTYELTKLFLKRGIITTRQLVSFADEGEHKRPLDPSLVLYPQTVCRVLSGHTFTEPTNQLRMPTLIMVVMNT